MGRPLGIVAFAMIGALALGAVGCAASAEEDEGTATQSEALKNTGGGGDPDACKGAQGGCYASCKTSGNASCYHYCDIVYEKCRGLPPSTGVVSGVVARVADPASVAAP